jgi:hypothetical protein
MGGPQGRLAARAMREDKANARETPGPLGSVQVPVFSCLHTQVFLFFWLITKVPTLTLSAPLTGF